jgi:NADH-quinone oxidoreductase subunit C
MATLDWIDDLKSRWQTRLLQYRESAPQEPEFRVRSEDAPELLSELRALPGGSFDHLSDLTAYEESLGEGRFHIVYELISMSRKQRARVIGTVANQEGDAEPRAPSVTKLWSGADWLEREVFDMFGIHFDGHPGLRRILLPSNFVGYPLRKDFVVDYRQNFIPQELESEGFDPFGNTIIKGQVEDT